MLKDHKSAMHLEGVTFDKVIRNSNGTEQFLNFLLLYNCQLEIMRFKHSIDNMFLFSNHNVTHMNVSKQYNENRGVRALLTIRKHQINLPPSSNFFPKMVPLTGTVPLTYFMGYSESILCIPLRKSINSGYIEIAVTTLCHHLKSANVSHSKQKILLFKIDYVCKIP